jgi:N-acetylneuraminic acid mutarotase
VHQFSKANVEEVLPNGRAFHSTATYGNKMIIFGGINNTILQDYYTFNTAEGTWLNPPAISGKFPTKREKESCVLYDMMLVFFGGYSCTSDYEYETYYNEITALNIEQMKWINEIKTEGKLPKGRFSHSATLIGAEMYIFGGITNSIKG